MNDFSALVIFNLFVLGMLALDLGVFHRRAHAVSLREAAIWSAFWVTLSLAFSAGVYFWRGPEAALDFLTAYILEKSLSLDNVFVFAMIFRHSAVPPQYQHKLLFWGILGALVMRGVFIILGIELVSHFKWILYLFGLFLIIAGATFHRSKRTDIHPDRSPVLALIRRILPVTEQYEGAAFFVRRSHRILATPLFLVLVMIESIDVFFATDSIPAVFAVTRDPFILYTSNVLAILGLRALYFLLPGALARFHYLRAGVSVVLMFVGAKLVLAHFYELPSWLSLLIILGVLGTAILASLQKPPLRQVSHPRQKCLL